jgi:transposase-like protein
MAKSRAVKCLIRRRWTAADARNALAALALSGLSVPAFAARAGLDAQRLYVWRRRLAGEASSTSPAFIEVRSAAVEPMEIVLAAGYVVRVAPSFDAVAEFQHDPLSGHLFIFFSKRCDRVRIVYWDRNGFAMWTKRLERGRFRPTFSADGKLAPNAIEAAELALIVEGIDLLGARRRPRWQPRASGTPTTTTS